jgi:hypothetical protein
MPEARTYVVERNHGGVSVKAQPQFLALGEAIAALSPGARSELYILMRVGQGELGAESGIVGLSMRQHPETRLSPPYSSKIPTSTTISRKACTK